MNKPKVKRNCIECDKDIPASEDCLVLFKTPKSFEQLKTMMIKAEEIPENILGYLCRSCELLEIES